MKVDFEDTELKSLILNGKSRKYKKYMKDKTFITAIVRVYNIFCVVPDINTLKTFSFLHYESLKYQYRGLYSVRIKNNRVERLIFREEENGIKIIIISMEDNHYGNKK